MANYTPKTKEQREEEMKVITEKLEQGVNEIFTSGRYEEWLQILSKFHSYSFNNQILIMTQRPTCSRVAGYKQWEKDFGRHVKRGEKAIKILGPKLKTVKEKVKDEQGNEVEQEKKVLSGFMILSVFGDDQTEGNELPDISKDLEGNLDGFEDLKVKIEKFAPCPVTFENLNDGSHGYFSPNNNRIVIKSGMSEIQTIKTMIHEVAHSVLHCKGGEQEKVDRNKMEVQAESVAYSVCQFLGIDTSDYSFGYVAGWSEGKDIKELKESMEIIRKTATDFIKEVA